MVVPLFVLLGTGGLACTIVPQYELHFKNGDFRVVIEVRNDAHNCIFPTYRCLLTVPYTISVITFYGEINMVAQDEVQLYLEQYAVGHETFQN
jgi:hypothetical protein